MASYDRAFYRGIAESARRSARKIVPLVLRFVPARSVIDIGCGTGAWLSVFAENGVGDILGVDGGAVPLDMLQIPNENFQPSDLSRGFASGRRFDLVISLEVAEHLPPGAAASFVESLVRLGSAVLFSAAVPGQGGTRHVNEQWQDYWAGLFARHGYVPVDCVRSAVWEDRDVAWWYAQNMLLYCERGFAEANAALARASEKGAMPLNVVHPRKLEEAVWAQRLARAAFGLGRIIPAGGTFLLIDEGTAGDAFDVCGRPIPFPAQGGSPAGSAAAIAEMQAAKDAASHVVMVEPAFWYLSFYSEWSAYLQARSELVLETDLLKVFALRSSSTSC